MSDSEEDKNGEEIEESEDEEWNEDEDLQDEEEGLDDYEDVSPSGAHIKIYALQMKEDGNALFQSKRYLEAHQKYHEVLRCLEYLNYEVMVENFKECQQLKIVALLNTAACSLKLKNAEDSLLATSKALEFLQVEKKLKEKIYSG